MKILQVASECVPFAKTGGLADVVGALPSALKKKRHDVRIVLPKYAKIDVAEFGLKPIPGHFFIPLGDRFEIASLWEGKTKSGVPVYFLENEKYFGREELYRTQEADYEDNDERFIFFSRAALEAAKFLDFKPDIVHCHDWQTGLIPVYLKTLYKIDAFYHRTASVFTIHNMAYQGIFSKETLFLAGLGWHEFTTDKLEYYDKINFLKAGIVYADLLNTVSPTYAREIQSSPEMGSGLEGTLAQRSGELSGILNGLDTQEWNPATDAHLASRYSALKPAGKAKCKADLQKTVGFAVSPDIPVIGMVSRLDPQKGCDLVLAAMDALLGQKKIQWVVVGLGNKEYHDRLAKLSEDYPEWVHAALDFAEPLAHKVYAGADLFLMPSRFEPCGLGQMIAMRYGAAPIVSRTGGLVDTVEPFDAKKGEGEGFVCSEISAAGVQKAVLEAVSVFENKPAWKQITANAFRRDFSWDLSVQEYLKMYAKALDKHAL